MMFVYALAQNWYCQNVIVENFNFSKFHLQTDWQKKKEKKKANNNTNKNVTH